MSEPRYPSRYGVRPLVTAAQYLAELMCERRAKKEKKTLPAQFWKIEEWKKIYLQQVRSANALITRVDPGKTGVGARAISALLRSERGKAFYSLSPAWIVPLVEEELARLSVREDEQGIHTSPPVARAVIDEPPRPAFSRKKSLLSTLRAIDGEGEKVNRG